MGIGLPPPQLQRDLMAGHFDDRDGAGWGELVAYLQPAMTRVVQAAGRLIRGPTDRGIICLVDPRFTQSRLTNFFPAHWRPHTIRAAQIEIMTKSFWEHDIPSDAV